ncbi:MAG TPA: transcriptional repressor [bacterium]|nr:transcriptional repressor [bacterium]
MSRHTKQREAILRVLQTEQHPTVQRVHQEVRRELPHISLGTVYRDLHWLKEEGAISEVSGVHESHFDGNARSHYHFHCRRCGSILDLDVQVDGALDRGIARRYRVQVDGHKLDFYGLCADCLDKE